MKIESIRDAFAANEYIKNKLISTVEKLTADEAVRSADAAVWNAQQLVEHVAMVDEGIFRICEKLLSKAEAAGAEGDGSCGLSEEFKARTANAAEEKFTAPDYVHPTGTASIADSLAKLNETDEKFRALEERFDRFDGTMHKFPHPIFGDLSANEWLVLRGGHAARHIRQIEARLAE